MASINESRDVEPGSNIVGGASDLVGADDRGAASGIVTTSDVIAASDDYPAQLARVVLEWWPALASSTPSRGNELWMSRNMRRSQLTR